MVHQFLGIGLIKEILQLEDEINALWKEHDSVMFGSDEEISDFQTGLYREICFLKGKQLELLAAVNELQYSEY